MIPNEDSAFINAFSKQDKDQPLGTTAMGLLEDFTKGFALFTGLLWVFAIIGSLATGQTVIALLLLIVLMIPVSVIALEHLRNRKKTNISNS